MEESVHKTLGRRGREKPLLGQGQPGTLPLERWPVQPGIFLCFPLFGVSGIYGNLLFNFMLGNLILSFPKGQYKKPISFCSWGMGSMSGMVKLDFIFFPWRNIKYLFTEHEAELSIIHCRPSMAYIIYFAWNKVVKRERKEYVSMKCKEI